MKKDPVRLFNDPALSRTLRDDLRAAETDPGPRYDVAAEARRFSTLVASSSVATHLASAAKGSAPIVPFGVKIVGFALVGLLAGSVTLKVLGPSNTRGSAKAISAIPSYDIVPPEPPIDPPSSVTEPRASALDAPSGLRVKVKPAAASTAHRALPNGRPAIGAATFPVQETAKPSVAAPEHDVRRDGLKEEMSQLAAIRAIGRTDPARAVDLVQEGHARFSQGVFWQEREVLAITSLVSLGRQDEARVRADAVLKRYPESPFAESLRRVVASSGSAAPSSGGR